MRTRLVCALSFVLSSLAACETGERSEEPVEDLTPTVVLETSKGRIILELDKEKAPITVENFLWHVQGGFYNGLVFHRVMPGFVIQTGLVTPQFTNRQSTASFIENEAANGLHNLRGTVAMARTRDINGARSQFFINLANNTNLDFKDSTVEGFGYAVFGRVIEGMDVVDSIAAGATRVRGQHRNFPVEPVVIRHAYVRTETAEGT
ncbi:MAG: peptidylprolyl isomerase [Gemmatimonadales bacterium]